MQSKIDRAVEQLRAACGFENLESVREAFLDLLSEAVK